MKNNILYLMCLIMSVVQMACTESLDVNENLEMQKKSVLSRFEQFADYAKIHSEGLSLIYSKSKDENVSLEKFNVETDRFILKTVTNIIQNDSQFARIIVSVDQRKDCIDHLERIIKDRSCMQIKAKILSRGEVFPTDDSDQGQPITVSDYARSLENQIATSELVTDAQRLELSEIYTVEVGTKEIMEADMQKIITTSSFLSLSEKEQNDLLISAAIYIDSANYWMEHLSEWTGMDSVEVTTRAWSDWWGKVKQVAKIDADGAFWGAIGGAISGAVGGASAGALAGGIGAVPGAGVGAFYGGIGGALSGAIVESARGGALERASSNSSASDTCSSTSSADSTESTATATTIPNGD